MDILETILTTIVKKLVHIEWGTGEQNLSKTTELNIKISLWQFQELKIEHTR